MLRKVLILLILPLIIYVAVVLFITYPLVTQLSTDVIGTQFTDSFEFVRLGWWQAYALQHGLSPFYESLFAYPDGYFDQLQWTQPIVYWPTTILNYVVNPVAAFNLWILTVLVLNGLTAYWLCLAIIDDLLQSTTVLAALLGGLVFMVFQTAQGHLSVGHVNVLTVFGLPVLAWVMYSAMSGRNTRKSLAAGAVAFCVLLLSNTAAAVYMIFPLYLFFILYLALPVLIRRQPISWGAMRGWAIIATGGILLSLPFYLPLIIELFSSQRSDVFNANEIVHYSTDLLAFATISPNTPWTKFADNPTSSWIINVDGVEGAAYLGLITTVLAIVALAKNTSKAKLWVFIALGSMILSLGPVLKWAGSPAIYSAADFSGTIIMPWALFQNLPVFNIVRTPGRINFITGLCLGVLASLGLVYLLRRIRAPILQIALVVVLAVIAIAENQEFFPFPTIPARLPQAFYNIAERSDIRAVLDVPSNSITGIKEALFEQTAHHKPLIAGYVVRRTPVSQDKILLLSNVAMGLDYRLTDGQPLDPDTARAVLKANGVDVLVYHWKFVDKAPVLRWATQAFGRPLYDDDQTTIFVVPEPDKPVEASAIVYDGVGWSAPDAAPWLGAKSSMIVYAPMEQDRHWSLKLSPLLTARQVKLAVDGQYQRTIVLTPPAQPIDFWLNLSTGFHRLDFTFPEGCTPIPVIPTCLVGAKSSDASCQLSNTPVTAAQEICVSAEVSSISVTNADEMSYHSRVVHLGQGLLLEGFRLPSSINANSALTVETDWQSQQQIEGDYHYFVHVIGADGTVSAQYDTVPDNGQFPTTKWAARQQWRELDSIPMKDAHGTYGVYVGWYRYPDLTRLNVQDSGPHAADGLVYLGDIQVK